MKKTKPFLLVLAAFLSFGIAYAAPVSRDGGNSQKSSLPELSDSKRYYRIGYQAMLEGEFDKAIVYYVRCAKSDSSIRHCSDAIQVAIATKQNVNLDQSDIQKKVAKYPIRSGTYESASPKGNLRSVNPYSEEAKQIIDAYNKHYTGF